MFNLKESKQVRVRVEYSLNKKGAFFVPPSKSCGCTSLSCKPGWLWQPVSLSDRPVVFLPYDTVSDKWGLLDKDANIQHIWKHQQHRCKWDIRFAWLQGNILSMQTWVMLKSKSGPLVWLVLNSKFWKQLATKCYRFSTDCIYSRSVVGLKTYSCIKKEESLIIQSSCADCFVTGTHLRAR